MRNRLLIPKKYAGAPATPWKVDIPASIAGKRTRRFFATKLEALQWCEDFANASKEQGVEKALGGKAPVRVHVAVKEWVASRSQKARPRQKETLRRYEIAITTAWKSSPLESLTVADLERWLDRPNWSERTRYNAAGYLHAFFAWCHRREMVSRNVAAVLLAEREKPIGAKEILSPFEMRLLLHLTRQDPIMRAFLVLGAFAGLRSSETMRLQWSMLDWEEREIHIPADVIKKTRGVRQRYVKMRPLFLAHCPRYGDGAVIPLTQRGFQLRLTKLRRRMQRFLARIGSPLAPRWESWPDNCLRHSFASYLLAEKEDAGYVAHQLGHTSPAMIHESYARAVRKKDLVAWNALCVQPGRRRGDQSRRVN